jgi:hypothetical protein
MLKNAKFCKKNILNNNEIPSKTYALDNADTPSDLGMATGTRSPIPRGEFLY